MYIVIPEIKLINMFKFVYRLSQWPAPHYKPCLLLKLMLGSNPTDPLEAGRKPHCNIKRERQPKNCDDRNKMMLYHKK